MGSLRANRIHARVRALQRAGIELKPSLEETIVRKIQAGEATYVEKTSRTRSVFDVELDEIGMIRVVYCKDKKQLITVLPREEADVCVAS